MKSLYIRKLDKLNFVLAEKYDEPIVREIAGNEVVYEYKNKDLFYGNLYNALVGLAKHTKKNIDVSKLDISFKKIRPENDEKDYMSFLEVRDSQIWTNLGLGE